MSVPYGFIVTQIKETREFWAKWNIETGKCGRAQSKTPELTNLSLEKINNISYN